MKVNKDLPKPIQENIEKFLTVFQQDKKAKYFDNTILKVIKTFPLNDNLENIILKTSVINDLYSTNIFSIYQLAEHILNLDFDNAIKTKNLEIVNKIASGHGIISSNTEKEFNFYSFATKYCSWHDQLNFPIYDRYIDFALKIYNSENHYVENDNFRNYSNLIKALQSFRTKHSLENYSLKEIDKFLWYVGKENIKTKTQAR